MSESAHELDNKPIDYLVTAFKGGLGAVPFVGSLLAEFAGSLIPSQRLDRLVDFAEKLNARLDAVEQLRLAESLRNAEFGEIAKEAMRQATNSITDERRKYLASVVAEALDEQRRAYADSRQVLRLLGQISDLQVIVLRSYLVQEMSGDEEFRERHKGVLDPVVAFMGSGQETVENEALWKSHRDHLERLGLLHRKLKLDSRTKQPMVDPHSGQFATGGYELTSLGRVILRSVGLTMDGLNPT